MKEHSRIIIYGIMALISWSYIHSAAQSEKYSVSAATRSALSGVKSPSACDETTLITQEGAKVAVTVRQLHGPAIGSIEMNAYAQGFILGYYVTKHFCLSKSSEPNPRKFNEGRMKNKPVIFKTLYTPAPLSSFARDGKITVVVDGPACRVYTPEKCPQ